MIGVDIEKVERFKEFNKTKLSRIFTRQEIEYCYSFSKPYTHIAGIWCVKEAFIKACKDKTIPVKDIEVKHNENGAPYIEITKKLEYVFILNNTSFSFVNFTQNL